MRLGIVAGVVAVFLLAGCDRQGEEAFGSASRGRYVGIGHFAPGQMWTQIVRAAQPAQDGRARPADDEQLIVVMDSQTGEVRQCGNLTGFCTGLNPWAKAPAAGAVAPVAVSKHADQIEAERSAARPAP